MISLDSTFSLLWQIALQATPITTCLLALMYYMERSERLELRRERDALLERVLTAMGEMRGVLRDIVKG